MSGFLPSLVNHHLYFQFWTSIEENFILPSLYYWEGSQLLWLWEQVTDDSIVWSQV